MYISASDTFSFAFFPFSPPRVGRWSQGSSRWWGSRESGWVDVCMYVYVDGVASGCELVILGWIKGSFSFV